MLETIKPYIDILSEMEPLTAITLAAFALIGYALHIVSIAIRKDKNE